MGTSAPSCKVETFSDWDRVDQILQSPSCLNQPSTRSPTTALRGNTHPSWRPASLFCSYVRKLICDLCDATDFVPARLEWPNQAKQRLPARSTTYNIPRGVSRICHAMPWLP